MPWMHGRLLLRVVSIGALVAAYAHAASAQDTTPAAPAPVAPAPSTEPSAPVVHYDTAPTYAPPPPPVPETPLPYHYTPAPTPKHAPRFALWTGLRLSFATFGNSFFRNENGQSEVSGNFIKPGMGTELNLGVRLEKRYIPYLVYERYWSFGAGRRFEGQGGSGYGQFYGFGFRYVFGNPDFIAGFTDLSFGMRSVHVSSLEQSFSMSTFEFFRLGLGAEIRLHQKLTISPQATLSSGVMRSTSGSVTYSPARQTDGISQPRFRDGQSIEDSTSYLVFGLGLGGHVDLFGK